MWGHYADSHKGCCLEFTFPILSHTKKTKEYWELNIPKQNQNQFPSIIDSDGNLMGNPVLWRVKYSKKRANWNSSLCSMEGVNKKYEYDISSTFITKDVSWCFEKELRILFNIRRPDIIRNDMFFISDFNPYISRIFLGIKSHVSIEKVKTIVRLLTPPNALYDIVVQKVICTPDTFEVIAEET